LWGDRKLAGKKKQVKRFGIKLRKSQVEISKSKRQGGEKNIHLRPPDRKEAGRLIPIQGKKKS